VERKGQLKEDDDMERERGIQRRKQGERGV